MSIGERVRAARKIRRMSQKELADIVGITQPTISDLENVESATTAYAVEIANALGVSYAWLTKGVGNMNDVHKSSPMSLVYLDPDELELITNFREATQTGKEIIIDSCRGAPKVSRTVILNKG